MKADVMYKVGAPGDGGVVTEEDSSFGTNNICVFLENGKCKLDQDGDRLHYHQYWEYVRVDPFATKPAADPAAEVVPVATVVQKAMELAREHDWCSTVEQGLREIGIDPSKYIKLKDVDLQFRIPADAIKRYIGDHSHHRINPLFANSEENELLISSFRTLINSATTVEVIGWVEDIGEVD